MHENSKLVLLWNKNKMSSDSAFLLFDRLLIRNLYLNLNYEIVLFVAFLIGKEAAETLKRVLQEEILISRGLDKLKD